MNTHNQAKALAMKYAADPATKQCYDECMEFFLGTVKQLADLAARQAERRGK